MAELSLLHVGHARFAAVDDLLSGLVAEERDLHFVATEVVLALARRVAHMTVGEACDEHVREAEVLAVFLICWPTS